MAFQWLSFRHCMGLQPQLAGHFDVSCCSSPSFKSGSPDRVSKPAFDQSLLEVSAIAIRQPTATSQCTPPKCAVFLLVSYWRTLPWHPTSIVPWRAGQSTNQLLQALSAAGMCTNLTKYKLRHAVTETTAKTHCPPTHMHCQGLRDRKQCP